MVAWCCQLASPDLLLMYYAVFDIIPPSNGMLFLTNYGTFNGWFSEKCTKSLYVCCIWVAIPFDWVILHSFGMPMLQKDRKKRKTKKEKEKKRELPKVR